MNHRSLWSRAMAFALSAAPPPPPIAALPYGGTISPRNLRRLQQHRGTRRVHRHQQR